MRFKGKSIDRYVVTIASSLESFFSKRNRFQDHSKFSKFLAHDSFDLKWRENDTNVVKIRVEMKQAEKLYSVHNVLKLSRKKFSRDARTRASLWISRNTTDTEIFPSTRQRAYPDRQTHYRVR